MNSARRPAAVLATLAGIVVCAPFWWGFNLPFAWINAATLLVLLALASAPLKRCQGPPAFHSGV